MGQISSKKTTNYIVNAIHANDQQAIREFILSANSELIEQCKHLSRRTSFIETSPHHSTKTNQQLLAYCIFGYILGHSNELEDVYHLLRDILYPFLSTFFYMNRECIPINYVMLCQLAKENKIEYDKLILELVKYQTHVDRWSDVAYHLLFSTSRFDLVRQIRSLLQEQHRDLSIKCNEDTIYNFFYYKAYDSIWFIFTELHDQNNINEFKGSVSQALAFNLNCESDETFDQINSSWGLRSLIDLVMRDDFPDEDKSSNWEKLNDLYLRFQDHKQDLINHSKEVISVPDAVLDYIVYDYL